jgi:farnesyl-diphosphate farnesyltransferase
MASELLTTLLRDVSRAFYLSMRILPTGMREPVSLAYLLARAADTVADSRLLPPHERLEHLLTLRGQLHEPLDAERLRAIERAVVADDGATPGERRLMRSLVPAVGLLASMPPADRASIVTVVTTLTEGMEMDLRTFGAESSHVVPLATAADLDRYIYLVAGCVGAFWTELSVRHVPALRHWDVARMSAAGVRFGKALQLTNVLRDLPRDLQNGRCYLPAARLHGFGVALEDLVAGRMTPDMKVMLATHVRLALRHFEEAEFYVLSIPWYCVRLRLAALWPVLLGLGTLQRLVGNERWLDAKARVKVPRSEVYQMMALSLPATLSSSLLRRWMLGLRTRVETGLTSFSGQPERS